MVLVIILFVSCLEKQPAEPNLCNPRNCSDDCYIQTPSAGSTIIRRYDENSMEIYLRDFTEGCTEAVTSEINYSGSININRFQNNILDTTYSIEFDTLVVDSVSIMIDSIYYYEMTIGNESGMSQVFISDTLLFDLPSVDSIDLEQVAIDSVKLEWSYPYSEYFSKDLDIISFSLSKYDFTSNAVYDTVCDYSTSDSIRFSYLDKIELGHHIQYAIRAKFSDNRYTKPTFSDTVTYSFLKPDVLDWFPLNSQSIYMHWSFREEFVELLDSIRIEINCNPTVEIPFDPSETFKIINLSEKCQLGEGSITNIEFEHKLSWCSGDFCSDSTIIAKTFPIHNMQYISGTDGYSVSWDSSIVSIEPFYIDLYERFSSVDENYYNIPDETLPETNISLVDARFYAESLTAAGYLNLCDNCGFRLPTEIEWEYVARDCQSDFYENENCDKLRLYEYPIQVEASINCEYANYAGVGCDDNPALKFVGEYNGTNSPLELATSPAGLFDICGNAAEWVEQDRFPDKDMCRGGSYIDDENSVRTTSYNTYNSSDRLKTIGFRTVISAGEAIEALKTSLEQ